MRRLATLIPLVAVFLACTKSDAPATDTETAMAPAPAMMPVALSDADVSGTWTGTSTAVGSDAVMTNWTQVCASGSCKGTSRESKATTEYTYTLAGDSTVGVSKPFDGEGEMKGQRLIDHWTAHFDGGNVRGSGMMMLASRPDSVVVRYTFTGSKQQ
ncbi:MAG: hypothetical protein ACSLFK_13445 [Gemmatimonadaceae bacterium]